MGKIGVGRQATIVNVPQFLEMPDVQILAVCDVDSWRLDNAKRQVEDVYGKKAPSGVYKGCDTYIDFHDILARKDIDAVMISAPDHWHTPMALAAMEAGKDVSLEKPITRSIAEGRKLSDMASRLNRIFRVDSEMRSYRQTVRAAELVRNGRIGKVHTVTVGVPGSDVGCPPQPNMPVPKELNYELWQGPAPRAPYTEFRVTKPKAYERPGWMRHLFYCDGMITNWTVHFNDAAAWCADLERTGPVEIEGHGEYPPPESFWNVLLNFKVKMRFANGIQWTYLTDRPYFKIEGSEGWVSWVYAEHDKLQAEPASILDSKIGPNELHFYVKTDKQDFIDGVKTRRQTLEPAEVGHRVTSLGLLGQIAIQVGGKLQWDPVKERFVGNERGQCHARQTHPRATSRLISPRVTGSQFGSEDTLATLTTGNFACLTTASAAQFCVIASTFVLAPVTLSVAALAAEPAKLVVPNSDTVLHIAASVGDELIPLPRGCGNWSRIAKAVSPCRPSCFLRRPKTVPPRKESIDWRQRFHRPRVLRVPGASSCRPRPRVLRRKPAFVLSTSTTNRLDSTTATSPCWSTITA